MKKLNNKAFTIIELLIASMVFTSLLLLCMEGITRIAKAYVKNASISQANEFIKSITEEVTQQIKYGSSLPIVSSESDDITRICIGGNAYRIVLNSKSTDAVKKRLDQNCLNFTSTNPDFFAEPSAENLAPSGMRVLDFSLIGPDELWYIKIRVALGDSDLLEDSNGLSLTNVNADYKTAKCKPGAGSEYCAVMELSTTANRRMAN